MTDSHQRVDDTQPSEQHAAAPSGPAPSTWSSSRTASTWSASWAPATSTSPCIERAFDADVHVRGNQITLTGEPGEIALAERLLDELVTIIRTGQGVTVETVERVLHMLRAETTERPADVLSLNILSNRGRSIRPKTLNQKRYVDSIDKHTITFAIGPAGTGKTYLAMAKAVQALQAKKVNRIILTRPAVEAGERLGLPARHAEREDRPLPAPALRRAARHDRPRVDPQAAGRRHHRGRAAGLHARAHPQRLVHRPRRGAEHLARADEDVPDPAGLRLARSWSPATSPRSTCPAASSPASRSSRGSSTSIEDVSFQRLTAHDVVRHRLVGKIVAAYDEFDARNEVAGSAPCRPARPPATGRPDGRRAEQESQMSIEVLNESGHELDVRELARLSRFVMDVMRVHPQAELCIKAVDEATIAELNQQWMEKEGPTDVLAFPMDELRPGLVNEEPEEGVLGDLVLCPEVARAAGRGGRPRARRRDRAADRARDPAPAGLRPRRARRAPGDVRAAGRPAGPVAHPRDPDDRPMTQPA